MWPRRAGALCAGWLLLGPLASAGEGPRYTVSLEVPQTQRRLLEEHLDLFRWRDSDRLDQAQLRRLIADAPAQIGAFLASEGFYSPRIEVTTEIADEVSAISLTVVPGEPTRVGRFDLALSGPAAASRLPRLRADWPLREGKPFRHETWEQAKQGALRSLLVDGYPAATILSSQATVDPSSASVALALALDSGPAFSLGGLRIEGLRRYPPSVVERLNPIRPGEAYSQAKLLDLQARLQDSPYFSSVRVSVDTDPARPDSVPVQVEVEELPARSVGVGVGVSTDTGPRVQVDYRDLNLFGRALRLSTTLKASEKEQSAAGELQLPTAAGGTRDTFSADFTRTDVAGEVARTFALGARRSRLSGRNEVTWGLRFFREERDIAGAVGDRSNALIPSWSLVRRDVDSLLYPRRGYLLSLQADAAQQGLLSDQSFARGYARASWFRPLGRNGQLNLRGELGAALADNRDGIPSDFLFRTGGDQTVRGYAYQSIGVEEGEATVGGRWLLTLGVEYVHWLSPRWGAALFVDAGDAADRPDDLRPVLGYGLGARWKSPIGLLGLDLAHGRETGQDRLHFAVGFSF